MAGTKQAKVGIQDAMELMPRGRVVYEAVRNQVTGAPDALGLEEDRPNINVLRYVMSDYETMRPPLPYEVIETIEDFVGEYEEHIESEGLAPLAERFRLERVGKQLLSVVYEYGYAAQSPAVSDESIILG